MTKSIYSICVLKNILMLNDLDAIFSFRIDCTVKPSRELIISSQGYVQSCLLLTHEIIPRIMSANRINH